MNLFSKDILFSPIIYIQNNLNENLRINEHLFDEIISPVIKELYSEVVIIGMFFVGFSYIRYAVINKQTIRTHRFGKWAILLTSVMLFTIYTVLSYNIDVAANVKQSNLDGYTSYIPPRLFLILMTLLEFILITISGSLFLILGMDAFGKRDATTSHNFKDELSLLFIATALWHLGVCLWYVLWYGSSKFTIPDLGFHLCLLLVHLISFSVWRYISTRDKYEIKFKKLDWIGVGWYTGIMIIVFIVRMSDYSILAVDIARKSLSVE